MPYRVRPMGGKYQVVDNKGHVYGTHPSRTKAEAQIQAIWASEKGKKK